MQDRRRVIRKRMAAGALAHRGLVASSRNNTPFTFGPGALARLLPMAFWIKPALSCVHRCFGPASAIDRPSFSDSAWVPCRATFTLSHSSPHKNVLSSSTRRFACGLSDRFSYYLNCGWSPPSTKDRK